MAFAMIFLVLKVNDVFSFRRHLPVSWSSTTIGPFSGVICREEVEDEGVGEELKDEGPAEGLEERREEGPKEVEMGPSARGEDQEEAEDAGSLVAISL